MRITILILVFTIASIPFIAAQDTPKDMAGPSTSAQATVEDSVTITVILKHQQDKNLPEIRRILESQGFWDIFPPVDAKVVSWNIAMGLGHIIVLELPTGAIRRLNLAIENGAWGAYDSEIYLTYDYKEIWEDYIEKREEAKAERQDD
jgi:hypothetical protein